MAHLGDYQGLGHRAAWNVLPSGHHYHADITRVRLVNVQCDLLCEKAFGQYIQWSIYFNECDWEKIGISFNVCQQISDQCLFRFRIVYILIKVRVALKSDGPGHAKTCLMPYANNKGADQPAHPRSQISTFVVRRLDSICILALSKVPRF